MHPLLNKVLDPPLANIYNDNDNHDKSNGYTATATISNNNKEKGESKEGL